MAAGSTTSMNLLALGITQPPNNSNGAVPPRVKASRQQTENALYIKCCTATRARNYGDVPEHTAISHRSTIIIIIIIIIVTLKILFLYHKLS